MCFCDRHIYVCASMCLCLRACAILLISATYPLSRIPALLELSTANVCVCVLAVLPRP